MGRYVKGMSRSRPPARAPASPERTPSDMTPRQQAGLARSGAGQQVGRPVGPRLSETATGPSHSVASLPLSGDSHRSIKTLMRSFTEGEGNKNIPAGSSRRLTAGAVFLHRKIPPFSSAGRGAGKRCYCMQQGCGNGAAPAQFGRGSRTVPCVIHGGLSAVDGVLGWRRAPHDPRKSGPDASKL